MKFIVSFLIVLVFLISGTFSQASAAITPPNFPMCSNPIGNLQADYATGTHGIVGNVVSFSGADKVYTFANDNALQCFCPENGSGIQTNWWKIESMTEAEIRELENDGWLYVANGANWGLAQGAYLAKNISYSCSNDSGNGGGGSSSSNSGDGSSSSSSSSNSGSGGVLGAGSVLGLATTGSMVKILEFIVFGFALIATGIVVRKTVKA